MRGLALGLLATLGIGCFGKVVDDSTPWNGTLSNGIVAQGPTYSTECTPGGPMGGTDDSCLDEPLTCDGAATYDCYDYSTDESVAHASTFRNGSAWREGSIGHYQATSPSDQVTGGMGSRSPDRFKVRVRLKVSADSGAITLARARFLLTDLNQVSAVIEHADGRLRMCSPPVGIGRPTCVDLGRFGREVWHTVRFELEDGMLVGQLDCAPTVTTPFRYDGALDPRAAVVVDYGVIYPTCASDVFIDAVRTD